jgi:predicted O-linked N-acetylglucosamine transferase (SPINDLY family)
VFSLRPAAVQVSYLGFPGTMGADYIDYLVADPIVLPARERAFYNEKVVSLPDSYQATDNRRPIAERTPTRIEHGLPASGFVFACFNSSYKIVPRTFELWVKILQLVDGSALWLLDDTAAASANLRREAAVRGLDPARLVFAPRLPAAEHLARHRCADLFLDTLPCGAHTTASDALWSGLPVLTCLGETFPGRVAASLLNAAQLPELVTHTPEDYVALAVALAHQPAMLERLRRKLQDNRLATPLFDTPRLTRHLEAAYIAMRERSLAGLPPDHVDIHGA